uniref:Uncharacterized protein n=1 Tax=Arundo donax TaxID=35708 RepID=A0A0A8ZFF1_ARUDO
MHETYNITSRLHQRGIAIFQGLSIRTATLQSQCNQTGNCCPLAG